MLLVSDRPILVNGTLRQVGVPFDTDEVGAAELLRKSQDNPNGVRIWHAKPPKVLYEKTFRKQDDASLREQGINAVRESKGLHRPSDERPDILVSCICLTRNRRDWLPKAIACYQRQTYPSRELLIIADGEDVQDLIPSDDETIRLLHIEEGYTVGEKRNFGASKAKGEIIAHWDDDDHSEPNRLTYQIERLQNSGKAVTGYRSMVFRSDTVAWLYTNGNPTYALGTSLCYRKEWWQAHPFLSIQIGEDGEFVKTAQRCDQIISADAGDLMVATVHPGNTSRRNLTASEFQKIG